MREWRDDSALARGTDIVEDPLRREHIPTVLLNKRDAKLDNSLIEYVQQCPDYESSWAFLK